VSSSSADEAKTVIETGTEGMPGFADQLSAEEIQALADYVVAGGM